MRWQRLFREATQLKTVAAAVCEIGGKGLHGKIQKYTVSFTGRGCPTVPVVTDISCDTFIVCPPEVAVARGGAHKASSWLLLPYLCLTLAAEACGAHSNVSCGPPRSEASARATLKGRKSTAPCSAQRGAKTCYGFRARRTSTAQSATQSALQFSAPCPPHCGSAFAPPRFRAPCAIHPYSATAEIAESLL